MDINFIEYNPIKAKSYILFNKNLATKKAIINIKNEDNQYKELKNQAEKINWDKIEFPVSLNQITQFEKNNQDISVNVYGYENSEVHILHVSKNNDRKHLIDLLLTSNGETNHYCLIKNLSRLLSSQTSRQNTKVYYCRNCSLGFNSEESLSNHKSYCDTHDSVRIELPPPNSTIQFTNHNKSMRVPFVEYADFESQIEKQIDTCEPNPNESYTKQYQKHILSSFCYYFKCFDESFYQSSPVTFTASSETDDVAQIFVDSLQEDIKKICDNIKFPKKMIFTPGNKDDFNAAISCHICGEDLVKDKVRDHCHFTGKYRVLFHNLSGYDFHLFIKKLSGGKLSCIPNNEEKYISFSREIKLDEYIKEGVYPYDWVDSVDKFNETQLPPKELFFSKLNNEDISDNEYSHAQTVWKEFHCKTFRDYHDLYNVSDVFLLADVFENFRDVCMNCYKLDPAWYYTSPGLAWDAALKKIKVKLELLSDYDMILMIKKGTRGGISMISNRLGASNNKYMGDDSMTKAKNQHSYNI
ncbi:uncharacterized protein LOC136075766 [Hydra vulgaris]|uniref:Uncharacterized protein LOC136075766 n=1 Tax=Hydra vulgaris TaxID=6087 RepID=A0ABM4B8S5_HYDVU